MKVAYIFKTNMVSTFQLAEMILPQMERNIHGAEVVGMFFLEENVCVLREGNKIGERLNQLAKKRGMLVMACYQCALRRDFATWEFSESDTVGAQSDEIIIATAKPKDMIETARVGYLHQLYREWSDNMPDLVITL